MFMLCISSEQEQKVFKLAVVMSIFQIHLDICYQLLPLVFLFQVIKAVLVV